MSANITFTAAALGGPQPIETIGFVTDFDFSHWPLTSGSNAFYQHDGTDFVRLGGNDRPRPEAGGNFSWLLRKPRWEQLLALEEAQFGAFGAGDLLRITEVFHYHTAHAEPIVPRWHRDTVHRLPDFEPAPDPHMYLVGSRHRILNAEIALTVAPLPPLIDRALAFDSEQTVMDADLTAYFEAAGGIRQLGAGEVVRMKVAQPHRSAPHWRRHPAHCWEFGRLKVLRAQR